MEEGIVQIRQGLTEIPPGAQVRQPPVLALLAEAYGDIGQAETGLTMLAEALAMLEENGLRYFCGAELHRLKGELLLS